MKKLLLSFFVLTLLLPITAKAEEFNEAQKAEIKKLFEEYLAESGDQILQSVNKHQAELAAKEQAEANKKAAEFAKELEDVDNLAIGGNPDGDVTLIEFFDYNCGYCRRALEEINKVLKDDDNVKVVFKEMPILGPSSLLAAKWSLASLEQDKYFDYHQAILKHNGQKTEKVLEDLAKDVGLDVDKLRKDAESDKVKEVIDQNLAYAQELNIRGTPGFVIAGQVFPGFIQADQIHDLIRQERDK